MNNGIDSKTTADLGIASAATIVAISYSWLSKIRRSVYSDEEKRYVFRKEHIPEKITWLDQEGYDVLSSFCDTFVPTIDAKDISLDTVFQALDTMHPGLKYSKVAPTKAGLENSLSCLCRGAGELKIFDAASEALQHLITAEERLKLVVMLKLLSYSAGNFLITGVPVPFQVILNLIFVNSVPRTYYVCAYVVSLLGYAPVVPRKSAGHPTRQSHCTFACFLPGTLLFCLYTTMT
jgi:hypothetical protein